MGSGKDSGIRGIIMKIVKYQVDDHAWTQLWGRVWIHVDDHAWTQVWNHVWNQVDEELT